MSVVLLQEAARAQVARVLPKMRQAFDGARHMSWYLGNGKDGMVFRAFDPRNELSRRFDIFAVKVWNPEFRSRSQEADLLEKACAAPKVSYRVPRLVHLDLAQGCMVMDRVVGQTAYREISMAKRHISESFYDSIRSAVMELNHAGIVHNDLHLGNWMLEDVETVTVGAREVIVDASIWIIDFSRAFEGSGSQDLEKIEQDLGNRVVEDPE